MKQGINSEYQHNIPLDFFHIWYKYCKKLHTWGMQFNISFSTLICFSLLSSNMQLILHLIFYKIYFEYYYTNQKWMELTCALYTIWTPWKTIFFACSPKKSKICSTWASYGSPRSRMQSFRVPEVIMCCGNNGTWGTCAISGICGS